MQPQPPTPKRLKPNFFIWYITFSLPERSFHVGYLWGTFYSQIVYLWRTFYSQILSVRYFLFTDTLSVNNFFQTFFTKKSLYFQPIENMSKRIKNDIHFITKCLFRHFFLPNHRIKKLILQNDFVLSNKKCVKKWYSFRYKGFILLLICLITE